MASQDLQGEYFIAASQKSFFVRVVGLATMVNTIRLQEVLQDCRQKGFRRFIFDLQKCSGFDSTFMGILVGVAMGSEREGAPRSANGNGDERSTVLLVNVSLPQSKLLSGVGIDRLICLHGEPVAFPEVDLVRLEDSPQDPMRRIRSMVTAHEKLVQLGGRNVEKFGAFLDALKRELGEERDS